MRSLIKILRTSFAKPGNRGFTLIEMAIVTILVGIVLAAMSPLYSHYLRKQRIERTEIALTEIKNAIGTFRTVNGRYPCPASLTVTRDSPGYGREACDNENPPADPYFAVAPGTCLSGICIESSLRPAITFPNPLPSPPNPPTVTASPRVRVGFVPFRNINVDETEAYDGYGSRIVYVVTENLAYSKSFQANGGGIEISGEAGSVLDIPGTAHFLILSHGENESGAYKENGKQLPCPPATTDENENCNVAVPSAYIVSQIKTTGTVAKNYDDILSYFTQYEIPLWQYPNAPLHSDDIHQKPSGKVGFAIGATQALQKEGDVSGKIRAQDDPSTPTAEGRFMLEEICDKNGGNCFRPKAVAGQLAQREGMPCPPGKFMYSIGSSQAQCIDEVVLRCPDQPKQKFMTGIENGQIVCGDPPPPPGCPPKQVEICTKFFDLSFGQPGWIREVGDCYGKQTFACQNNEWTAITQPPTCHCENGSTTQTIPCGPGYTGTGRVVTTTIQCDPCNITTTTESNDCQCLDTTDQRTDPCPEGFTGSGIFFENHWRCTPPPPRWAGWQQIRNDCTCTAQDRTVNETCPPGQTGGPVIVHERFNCTTLRWEEISRDASSCVAGICHWNEGFSQGIFPTPNSGNLVGALCPCNPNNPHQTSDCYSHAPGGYNHFSQCSCE